MSRLFKGFTLTEGFTDLGTLSVDITFVESKTEPQAFVSNEPSIITSPVFQLLDTIHSVPLPGLKVVFTIDKGNGTDRDLEVTGYTNQDGFVQFSIPLQSSIKIIDPDNFNVIYVEVTGAPESRQDEAYLMVNKDAEDYYTLIRQFYISKGELGIFTDLDSYVYSGIGISNIGGIIFTATGEIYGFNTSTQEWEEGDQLEFNQFSNPAGLDQPIDGFYQSSGTSGTITTGTLGVDTFSQYSMRIVNTSPVPVIISVAVYEPDGVSPIYTEDLDPLDPTTKNITKISFNYTAPAVDDDTPTTADVATAAGITFSGPFQTFLTANDLNTVQAIRRAGPLKYLTGIPDPDAAEVAILQSYVDLYFLTYQLVGCTALRAAGYNSIYDIAVVPRSVFMTDMDVDDEYVYVTARAHEVAVQRVSLISNVLAASMNDSRLENPVNYAGANPKAYALFKPKCSCDDCQSGISPFAYLMDLLKYSAVHLVNDPDYTPASPVNYASFITLMKNTFYQPFGDYEVDCETLHHEYCRVRLATEVLLKLKEFTEGGISAGRLAAYLVERKQYLQLTYQNLLLQMGTSFDEVRSVFLATPDPAKTESSKKLAAKLGIPYYVPGSGETLLTTDTLWLTFAGNTDSDYDTFESSLQTIFGYRKMFEDVLVPTPESTIEGWRKVYLQDASEDQDYYLSAYSREDVIPATVDIKDNWEPIIDPDIMGFDDIRFFPNADVVGMYQWRKNDIDTFLDYYVKDTSGLLSRTNADMLNKIVRTPEDVGSDNVYENIVQIETASSIWDDFELISKPVNGTNVDFQLKIISDPFVQPYGSTPTMKYNRLQDVLSNTPNSGSFLLTVVLPFSAEDYLASGYVKLISTVPGETDEYTTTSGTTYKIDSIDVTGLTTVVIHFNSAVTTTFPDSTYLQKLQLIYEKEVELFTDIIPNPTPTVVDLFANDSQHYPPYDGGTDFDYDVWISSGFLPSANYAGLKTIYTEITNNDFTNSDLIGSKLHLTLDQFNRMMELFALCENYLGAMYTYPRPTTTELYELASYFRESAKTPLRVNWVEEEIVYDSYLNLKLTNANFLKALSEPSVGSWDSTLQTSPDVRPMLDPEYVTKEDIVEGAQGYGYQGILQSRINELAFEKEDYMALFNPKTTNAFTQILNKINQGSTGTPYVVPAPYNNLANLIDAVRSINVFTSRDATQVVWNIFGMYKDEFLRFVDSKTKYELDSYLINTTTLAQLSVAADVGVLGYKRHWLWFNGWIAGEDTLKYYDIFKMKLDPVRGSLEMRKMWTTTLEKWNDLPIIDPDVVPAENLLTFEVGNPAYEFWNARTTDYDDIISVNTILFNIGMAGDPDDLNDNFRELLWTTVFNDTSSGVYSQIYFNELRTREEAGENIQPRVEQLNLTMSAYRYLRKIYDILALEVDPAPLIESEYEDVLDIFLQVEKKQRLFSTYILEEYQKTVVPTDPVPAGYPILLTDDQFRIYRPSINNFPLTDLPVYNTWRSPFSSRRDWLNTLEGRINREKENENAWEKILMDTEDITMQAMRNALVKVLAVDCETFDQTAERLAKSLMIETKDNCCSRHTRISQAIETIQSFIFALKNGVYDEYLTGWEIQAPNFDREWEWLGSYAAWRSAMFVYLYPENILYPTLKRYQTPAFQSLTEGMQNASRLTPEGACLKGKEYEDYFFDIMNLDVKFTSVCYANVLKQNANVCCDDVMENIWVTYFFAKSNISGKSYYSIKLNDDPSDYSHGFWTELTSVPIDAELIGGFPLSRDHDANGNPRRKELWLTYSYRSDRNLVMAYVKKDLLSPLKDWSDETELDKVPTKFQLETNGEDVDFGEPFAITACQSTIDWDHMSFIFSYNAGISAARHILLRYEDLDEIFSIPKPLPFNREHINFFAREKPVTAIRHYTADPSVSGFNSNEIYGWSIVFNKYVATGNKAINDTNDTPVIIHLLGEKVAGAFQVRNNPNVLFVIMNEGYGLPFVNKITYISALPASPVIDYTLYANNIENPELLLANKICPVFSFDNGDNVFFGIRNGNIWTESKLLLNVGDMTFYPANLQGIAPTKVTSEYLRIESADCISPLKRADAVKDHVISNMNPSQTNINWPGSIMVYLSEAYYFVPMLIALDQQRRGQFEAALDWYRIVYDYTQNATNNRKIYYGLVLEQSLTNVFSRPADWLLDPLNPHLIAQTRANAYTRYTLTNIVQCLTGYGDREFTTDTSETVPRARQLYTAALDLLQVPELNVAPDACVEEDHCMPPPVVATFVGSPWENLFNHMQTELATINNAAVLDATRDDILEIFDDEMLSIAEQFTAIFELIDTAKAGLITTPLTVEEVVGGAGERFTVAMQFLEAPLYLGAATSSFMQSINDSYDQTMSRISGISVADLNASVYNESVLQLTDSDPLNSLPLRFQFMNDTGVQQRTGVGAYDPLNPTGTSRQLNLEYSNSISFLTHSITGTEREYAPLLDYYFCNPANPAYDSLKLKINVELYKIFNCRNIAGMQRELDIYGAATDSTSGIPIIGAQGNLVLPGLNSFKPSQYRFAVLIERAKQIVQQTSQIEAQFLSALEKRDAEYYNLMKARQDLQISRGTIKLQDLRIRQANDEKKISDIQLNKANYSYTNFNSWISSGLNEFEAGSLILMSSIAASQLANAFIAFGTLDFSGGASLVSSSLQTINNLMNQQASYERRAQEWAYQRQLASFDIDLANQQIKISEDNVRIVSQEREIAQMNSDFANDTLEFLKNKFTNAELYNWMSNVLEGVYAYMLNLSTAMARTAEGQLYFERQEPAGPFILDDYWESPNDNYSVSLTGAGNADRRGLTGSARLLQDITRLDQYAFDTNKRKLQISKTISLAQNFPEAFQRFRETGVLNFELTNDIFDHDFPGHYLRLINNVKTSLIGLVPVYGGIKASLTAETISYVVISGNNGATFQRVPINRLQSDSVALTSPTNATGLFEMQPLNGELLNPFEGMGIESKWEFKLPRFSNRMDYDQIADVVITVEYTALDSSTYRQQVLAGINNELSFNRAFSFKNNFPDQWYELANVLEGVDSFEVNFTTRRSDFPAGLDIDRASRLVLYFVRKDNTIGEVNIADFNISTNATTYTGTTVNGIFNAQNMLVGNGTLIPFQTWRLKFDNAADMNRHLFLDEDITDILFVITCDATLPGYV
jgi:hypothetical protein